MEWVTGIGTAGGRFVGEMLRGLSEREEVELTRLTTAGIPPPGPCKRMIVQELSEWQMADSAEYLFGFDKALATRATPNHLVFSTEQLGTRILIPALSLIRSFFRPARALVPMMFRPHAIDQVCHLDLSSKAARLVISPDWYHSRFERLGDIGAALRWMRTFPSAACMAASVHQHALNGIVGIQLPKARARLSLRGTLLNGTLHVGEVAVRELEATESPFDYAASSSRLVTYRQSREARRLENVGRIPLLPDSSVDVTDEEWVIVAPILVRHPKKTLLDQRSLFDGLLHKFAYQYGWSTAPYKVGGKVNAVEAYRRWSARGAFQAAVDVLTAHRNPVHK